MTQTTPAIDAAKAQLRNALIDAIAETVSPARGGHTSLRLRYEWSYDIVDGEATLLGGPRPQPLHAVRGGEDLVGPVAEWAELLLALDGSGSIDIKIKLR